MQTTDRIKYAAAVQINILRTTLSFVRTHLLIPYLSSYIDTPVSMPGINTKKKPSPVPVKSSRSGRLFGRLYYIMSSMLIGSREILLFLLVVVACMSTDLLETARSTKPDMMIIAKLRRYRRWILKFLTPKEKTVLTRDNEYDTARPYGLLWDFIRTLNNRLFGVRFFLCINHEKTI